MRALPAGLCPLHNFPAWRADLNPAYALQFRSHLFRWPVCSDAQGAGAAGTSLSPHRPERQKAARPAI